MNHLSEEQLILHYYGEEVGTDQAAGHLEACAECRVRYGSLQRVLNAVDALPVPERGPEYGPALWSRIAPAIPARGRWWWPAPVWRWAAVAAAASVLMVAAFVAGRFYPAARPAHMAIADPQARERILLLAVGDYLDRSQIVLAELANAETSGPLDITAEKERAADLVSESRLYRQTALHTGDDRVAALLDDLDRVLIEISHAPSRLEPHDLAGLRNRLRSEGILFKIRVLGSNVRNQEDSGRDPLPPQQKL
jgi:hypothetical protein